MKQKNMKTPIVFRLAVLLVFALLVSVHMMSGLYARYTAATVGASDTRVARFSVSDLWKNGDVALSEVEIALAPGESATYTIDIVNDSEVSVIYSVSYRNLTNNLPITATLQYADDPSAAIAPLAAGESTRLVFTVSWPKEVDGVPQVDASCVGMMDILQIAVSIEQAD